MGENWRIGSVFKSLKYISKAFFSKAVVGFVLHESHEGAIEKFELMWDEMRKLVPEDYYYGRHDFLKVELTSYGSFIIFDTYEQGETFVNFVRKHFDDEDLAFASMWVDGVFQMEST
jgi:hypothetical protein